MTVEYINYNTVTSTKTISVYLVYYSLLRNVNILLLESVCQWVIDVFANG